MITPPSFVFRCGSIFWSLLWNRLEVSTSLLTFLSSVWEYLNKLGLCWLQSLYSQPYALNFVGINFLFLACPKRCTCEVMSHEHMNRLTPPHGRLGFSQSLEEALVTMEGTKFVEKKRAVKEGLKEHTLLTGSSRNQNGRKTEQEDFITGKELADVLQSCGTLLQNLGLLETKRRKQLGYGKL